MHKRINSILLLFLLILVNRYSASAVYQPPTSAADPTMVVIERLSAGE